MACLMVDFSKLLEQESLESHPLRTLRVIIIGMSYSACHSLFLKLPACVQSSTYVYN